MNLEEAKRALVNAHKAGDTAAATAIARAIKAAQPSQEGPQITAPAAPPAQAGVVGAQPAPAPTPTAPASMSWRDVAEGAYDNAVPSIVQAGKDMATPFMHPIETAKTMGELGLGLIQKLIPGEQPSEKVADAVGQYFTDRYGSVEGIKKAMATDPAGVLLDASTVLTGVGPGVARLPGLAGKVGRGINAAGRATDPLIWAGKGVKGLGKASGLLSGAGGTAIDEAFKAGRKGGDSARAFRESVGGGTDKMYSVVEDAKHGLEKMREARREAYRSGAAKLSKDKTVLDFDDVRKALDGAVSDNTFNGVPKSKAAAKALSDVREVVDEWGAMDPKIYHTPEGFDALKQRIGDLMDWKDKGASENRAIEAMYNNVKGAIEKQAPTYAKMMGDYSEASRQIKEIEKSLSLGNTATADTALRKLTSTMRNNVNTNYGARANAVEELQSASGRPLMPALAGQALQSWMPRGLAGLGAQALVTGTAGHVLSPWAFATAPMQSPRIAGEAAYLAGRARGLLDNPFVSADVMRGGLLDAYEVGKAAEISERERQRNR